MGKIAFIFPGQGAQKVGMGKDVYDQYDESKKIFDKADEVLGYSLTDIIFNGPEETLKQTYHTQPALLVTSLAIMEAFKESNIQPDFVAGHSLGEYTALVAAGALSLEDAVRTVRKRGELMDQAVPSGVGAMAAVLGADKDKLLTLTQDITQEGHVVELANVNCPGQIVVSGSAAGVAAVEARAKEESGAKRVIPLEVSGPFHSSLMKSAASGLGQYLDEVEIKDASIPVISNVTAKALSEGNDMKKLLVEQVVSPVQWEDSVNTLLNQGVDTFYEIGSGKVLMGLVKKIDRSVKIHAIHDVAAIQSSKE
ncbi:ACP S-malonyltransferase [Longirhabdus pacifica]|uniref:ACP S-malonyltransferase n=1 Tax=Longirhabdus pacifica TaxID=2305227 RepID=UPI00100880F3|nr:ACP S-malonyltransferase [Longirhabdus pacifica]